MELEFVLEQAGHDVVGIATDTRQALTLAAEAKPELALVDINLKDGDSGVRVARLISSQLNVTVLFATAEPELIPEQFGGAYGVVVKPYSGPSVEAAVEYCLALRDGVDPGPQPSQLLLAPWVSAKREAEDGGSGEGMH